MGAGMAINLHRAGWLTAAWNRTRARANALAAEHGLPLAEDPAALAATCDLILLSVSADDDLFEVLEALRPDLRPGTVLMDTSTVSAESARRAAKLLETRDCAFLDAPVSGGREGAVKGTLAMMVGGDAATLDRVRPVLAAITARVVHMGPVGSGQATKAVNQIMAAGINQAVTEALAFGAAQGLDMARVIEVVSGGAAGNWFLEHRGRSMLTGDFAPGFRVALHHKDLGICRSMAEASNVRLPLVAKTLADYERLMAEGHGDEDISALYRLKRPTDV